MKNKFKKILLPFYRERHQFLTEKWWFRLIIVGYIIAFVITPFCLFSNYMNPYVNCYSNVIAWSDYGTELYKQEFANCRENVNDALTPAIEVAVLGTLIIHYLLQFVFFKIIIDFIVLGRKASGSRGVKVDLDG